MFSLIPNYIPMQILVGLGVGLVGGLLAVFLVPLPLRKHPATYADVVGFALLVVILLLPIIFPMTLFLALSLVFLTVWIALPVLFGYRRKEVRLSRKQRLIVVDSTSPRMKEIHEVVEMLSPEGRATVLDEMRIFQ